MRMQDKANGDSKEDSVGEINDQKVQQPQDDRKAVQKRSFTRWMNMLLQRCDPPVEVRDLFTDIQDGRILMALLEELSGCKLLYRFRSSSHRIFRLNNISKALAFLDDRHVKLLDIDASGIADGVPSVVLNLVWNIILHFQVKEVTGVLQRNMSSSLSSLSRSSYSSGDFTPQTNDKGSYSCNTLPSKGRKAAKKPKYQGKAIKTLLQWVQRCTLKFGVEVHNFGKSWRSGLAFLAVIKSINPALVDLMESLSREPRENIQLALNIAHHSLDIPPLLEPEDVLCNSPDEKSIITYVSMFLWHCTGIEEDRKTSTEAPGIPNFGSFESVSFGEILADDPQAKALLKGLEGSSEQQLWKRWAGRPSGSPRATSIQNRGPVTSDLTSSCGDIFSSCHSQDITEQPVDSPATSTFTKKKSKCRSVFKPPSPLDAGVVSQEIRSWMEKASSGQGYSKPRADESHFSLSSEEGIYSLSVLDSDEEEAYSYILELNKEDFQPYNQMKRQVPRVEEETAEEMLLNGQQTEGSQHLEVCETLNGNGCKHQEDGLAQNAESEAMAQSVVKGKFDGEKNGSSFGEMTSNRAVFDMEPEKDSMGHGEDRVVGGQSNDNGGYCEEKRMKEKTENVRYVASGYGPCRKSTQVGEQRDVEKEEEEENWTEEEGSVKDEEREKEPTVMYVESFKVEVILLDEAGHQVRGKIGTEEESDEDNVSIMEELTSKGEDKEDNCDEVKNLRKTLTCEKATTVDHPVKTASIDDTNGGVKVHSDANSWTPACSAASQSFRSGGFLLQPLAVSCDITPLELEMLLVLWILLYCCFILS